MKEDTSATAQAACVAGRGGGQLPSPFLTPDAVICCSYFITVLLAIIGLEAAKYIHTYIHHRLEQMEDLQRRPFAAPLAQLCS